MTGLRTASAFTLIEVILVVVIAGLLATVALRSAGALRESARNEEARRQMERLAAAVAGDPELRSLGVRADFGYVGDLGALPPDLGALRDNPGLAAWSGPYLVSPAAEDPADCTTDPWGVPYALSGVNLVSTGSGSPLVFPLAASADDLLRNSVAGVVLDADGTPPGALYADSLRVIFSHPDGLGGRASRTRIPDRGGYFAFDSVPVGNHDLTIIYLPDADTLRRFVSVTPGAAPYSEFFLGANLWSAQGMSGTGLEFVDNSDTLAGGQCSVLNFSVTNTTSHPITVSALTFTWPGPTAYYRKIRWNGVDVYSNPARGSGDLAVFTAPQTLSGGATARITCDQFKQFPSGGGASVNVTGVAFTVTFSDGSVITFVADNCR
ncbi:MAG TPA: prepilin-type N-terminal cleavage/methylation domain-containing protein [candidate division Zixibacteria bacterium]|nr:prepilin-type N-terminal cleavage/methylation domain-containing protein [candidate division Zixibacteria bacterium]MDD4916233.1 prepilin-type N-terminal cleavage/methylation domain-containing protein [candidate division Zixibacteria bacterium]MDM7972753.1 prepilin-type N-terminal cleavage/methylation domain-containing protein [candidate division Zixibacteria bacterium]HOD67027.1 prepilin-type N-terminal cleavage/methylation domain-containing protein [candidate division Zixibacteria bacterium]